MRLSGQTDKIVVIFRIKWRSRLGEAATIREMKLPICVALENLFKIEEQGSTKLFMFHLDILIHKLIYSFLKPFCGN